MLTSWFSPKSPQGSKELDQQRQSIDVLSSNGQPSSTANDFNAPRSSLDNPKPAQPTYTTPHDVIIAQLQASPIPEPIEYGRDDDRRSPDTPISLTASHSRLDLGLSPEPSMYTGVTAANLRYVGNQSNMSQQLHNGDLLLDPFDGTSHGILFPQDDTVRQDELQAAPRFNSASVAAASEGMWSHLSKVLDLQSQISKLHIDMEGIGTGDGRKKSKGKHAMGRGSTLREDRRVYHPSMRARARAMSNASTIGTVADEKEIDEEGVGVTDEETERNRAREEEFAKLANQFEGKKESIKEIMNKLDDLSKALIEFHALKAPEASTPKHSYMPATASPTAMVVPPDISQPIQKRGPATSSSLPSRVQLPENMLWAPPKPLVSPGIQDLPESLSRIHPAGIKRTNQNAPIPTLIVNSDVQPHVMESPASTLGSLHGDLPPEE